MLDKLFPIVVFFMTTVTFCGCQRIDHVTRQAEAEVNHAGTAETGSGGKAVDGDSQASSKEGVESVAGAKPDPNEHKLTSKDASDQSANSSGLSLIHI